MFHTCREKGDGINSRLCLSSTAPARYCGLGIVASRFRLVKELGVQQLEGGGENN